jgi:hypothetical protein
MDVLLALPAALGLAAIHLLADRIHSLHGIPHRHWLSFAGGTSVAFVFVHLMPELQQAQSVVAEEVGEVLGWIEHHVYVAALVGVLTYYGAEYAALQRTGRSSRAKEGSREAAGFFWVHLALFAVLNGLLGYLLVREAGRGWLGLAVLWLALALHLFANDFALREHHRADYHRWGRWILAAGVLTGWGVGTFAPLHEAVFAVPLAFAAGGIVLNALKEELPSEREGRFLSFALGAAVYAGLVLVV